ncbi:MAG: hypothetical protein OER80_13530 [Gammaproteobacteria bacterium]|nr:hypothetical protein [Gammaproteobacteria bacterium]MDH3769244.1 hypothetical protein [Gammaproteobacteria bacterium]
MRTTSKLGGLGMLVIATMSMWFVANASNQTDPFSNDPISISVTR